MKSNEITVSEFPSGHKAWFLGGNRHREDGPAIEDTDETKFWWFKGEQIFFRN